MKISNFRVERLRSAYMVELQQIGALNVLIGKNNSGKSTILSAINAFFGSLKGEGLVTLKPSIGREIDFHDRNTELPIVIAASFLLGEAERTTLVTDIVREAPQLRNLMESMGKDLKVEVSLTFAPDPDSYAYVSTLDITGSSERLPTDSRNLLTISPETANELAARQRRIGYSNQAAEQVQRFLENFDSDDFTNIKDDETDIRSSIRFNISNVSNRRVPGDVLPQLVKELEQMLTLSTSFPEFRARVKSLREQYISELGEKKATLKNLVQTFSGDQTTIPTYAENLLKRIGEMSVLFLGERREQVGRAEAAQLLQFKVQRGGFQRLGGIQKKISEMLNVQVDAFEDEANRGSDRTAEMDVDNFLLEVNGSGIKEALRLILDVEMKSPTLLLVEEPEIHLHPALENNMMRYLREVSAGCQVFITTHSTNFLDSPTTDNVYLISKTDKKTSARLLSVGEAEETLPEELGIRLSSLFLFDRLIFVEGVSDEQVIREFAATIGVNLTKANVGFIHMGGSRNFAYFASQATLDFLGRRQVKSFFVIDRDERTDADVQALKTMLQEKAVVHVLKRRELENYLLLVRPMTELVNWKLSQHGSGKQVTTVEEKNVQETLMKIVETYKPLVVAKRSAKRLLQPFPSSLDWPEGLSLEQGQKLLSDELERVRVAIDEKSKTVGGVFEETKKNVEGIWKNSLWEIVPGDELIDSVFRQFGARFKKVNDSPRLARSLRQDEIGAEIVTLLNSFVS